MMKNYSTLMMKDSKFKDNVINNGGTPFVQYLIKNNKYKATPNEQHANRRAYKYTDEVEESIAKYKAGRRSSTSYQDLGSTVKDRSHLGEEDDQFYSSTHKFSDGGGAHRKLLQPKSIADKKRSLDYSVQYHDVIVHKNLHFPIPQNNQES